MPTSLASFLVKRAEPYVANVGSEYAHHNEGIKAQGLRKILKILLLGGGAGAGMGLLSAGLGNKPSSSLGGYDPDVELGYPQLNHKSAGYTRPLTLWPTLDAGIQGVAGAVRTPDDPLTGGLYGGARGLGEGVGTGLGYVGGHMAGSSLAHRLGHGDTKRGFAGSIISGLLGAAVGNRLGAGGTDAVMRAGVGPPPWEKGHHKRADWADSAVHAAIPTPEGKPSPTFGSPAWFRGDSQNSIHTMPWFYPAASAAGIGGVWGGHHLVRRLIKNRRKAQLEAEVEAAKKEYEEAMLGQYDPAKLHTLPGDKEAAAGNKLDGAFVALTKFGFDVNSMLGFGANTYGTFALPLAGMTGYFTHKWLHDRSKSKVLADAIKQRALIRQLSNPADVYLHATPAHVSHHRHHNGEVEADNNVSAASV